MGKDRLQGNFQGIRIKGQNSFHNSGFGALYALESREVPWSAPTCWRFGTVTKAVTSHRTPRRCSRVKTLYAAGVLTGVSVGLIVNFSAQRMRPVTCMTTKSVNTEPMVMASPVKPFRKNA